MKQDEETDPGAGALAVTSRPGLPVPGRVDVKLRSVSVNAASKLAGALIYVASRGGGAGRDTLAAMLLKAAQMWHLSTVLVDIANRPGMAKRSQQSDDDHYVSILLDSQGIAEPLARIIWEHPGASIVVNVVPDGNPLLWSAEAEIATIIEQQGRPVYLFWMGHDEPDLRAVERYKGDGGLAKPIITGRARRGIDFGSTAAHEASPHSWTAIEVPVLPSTIRSLMTDGRLSFARAVEQAPIWALAVFETGWNGFLGQLEAVL